ncbi:MAG TPA: hypothetical protein VK589_05110 [Chryseolinea sp.]|nr:hypothetical protein [Chryseolinea sp.]
MKNSLLMFGVFVMMAGCECNDEPRPETSNDYLPLTIGNYWNFKATGLSDSDLVEHREVVDYVTVNNMEYYLLVSTHLTPDWSGSYKDSAYYRIDNNGFVYVYRKSIELEENRYRLNGKDGDTWSYDFVDQYIADMTLREASKQIGKIEVANCKDYSFNIEQWADEEYTYTLAPGVGFLKEFSDAWGGGQELKSARINGQEIEF